MDKDIFNKLLLQIDATLEKKGVNVNFLNEKAEIKKFKELLIKETEEKEKILIDEAFKIAKQKTEDFLFEKMNEQKKNNGILTQKIIEALSNVKFDPQISVNIPDVIVPKIELPLIRIPEIKAPTVNVPPIKMPDNISITGLKDLFAGLKEEIIKIKEMLSSFDRDNPMPVILTDEKGNFYRSSIAIAGGSMVGGGGGNGGEMLGETAGTLKQRISYVGATSYIEYVGEAQSDAKTSELKWRIKKMVYDANNNLLEINWCEGTTGFKYSWDLRATYNYN